MAEVKLINVNKIYDNNVQAVFDFNLDIKEGEFVVFVGPSGCGKSTTLRMIAGLEEISEGELYIDDKLSNDILAKNRDIAMVFQNYALYPHMTVYENMAFGLKNRKLAKEEINKRVLEAAEILGISEYLNRKPKALSGGQCQRVALGRAIVRHAKVFLMDEPLSNLDAKLRVQMRSEIINLHKRIGSIIIYVTHDQTEAMTMADRIVVMNKGRIQQIGTPREIYNNPKNLFVASFMGSPSMNFIDCLYDNGVLTLKNDFKIQLNKTIVEKHQSFYEEQIKDNESELDALITKINKINEKYSSKKDFTPIDVENCEEVLNLKNVISNLKVALKGKHNVILGIRPEDINVSIKPTKDSIECNVGVVELLGKNQIIHSSIGDDNIQVDAPAKLILNAEQKIYINFDLESIHIFDKDTKLAIL